MNVDTLIMFGVGCLGAGLMCAAAYNHGRFVGWLAGFDKALEIRRPLIESYKQDIARLEAENRRLWDRLAEEVARESNIDD